MLVYWIWNTTQFVLDVNIQIHEIVMFGETSEDLSLAQHF